MGEVTFLEVAKALHSARWTFAKTMPHNPHEWTLRRDWPGRVPFDAVVAYIRERGYTMKFGRRDYRCLDVNGFRYWTMGAAYEKTILINRAKNKPVQADYDTVAEVYDSLFEDPGYREENETVAGMLEGYRGPWLDIGCGTGLLIDMLKINPTEYAGIDPSVGMLKRLMARYPNHEVRPWRLEEYFAPVPAGSAVSLFGTPSYITPGALKRIPDLAREWFLMFFADDYDPVTHQKTGISPPVLSGYRDAPGKVTRLNNFMIVEGGH